MYYNRTNARNHAVVVSQSYDSPRNAPATDGCRVPRHPAWAAVDVHGMREPRYPYRYGTAAGRLEFGQPSAARLAGCARAWHVGKLVPKIPPYSGPPPVARGRPGSHRSACPLALPHATCVATPNPGGPIRYSRGSHLVLSRFRTPEMNCAACVLYRDILYCITASRRDT